MSFFIGINVIYGNNSIGCFEYQTPRKDDIVSGVTILEFKT